MCALYFGGVEFRGMICSEQHANDCERTAPSGTAYQAGTADHERLHRVQPGRLSAGQRDAADLYNILTEKVRQARLQASWLDLGAGRVLKRPVPTVW